MRAIFYCVTLSFFLIFHATHRFPVSSASPLPLAFPGIGYRTSGDVLASDSQQDFLVDGRRKQHVGGHRDVASTVDLNSPTVNVPFDAGSTVNEPTAVFHLEEYPYPTNTPQRSRTKPRRHSSTRVDDVVAVSSTSIVSGTLLVTATYALTPSSISVQQDGTPTPIPPLYENGTSPMAVSPPPAQSDALPWVLGFLIPIALIFGLILVFQWNWKNKQRLQSQSIAPKDSHSPKTSDLSAAAWDEKSSGLGIVFKGAQITSAMPTLPPVSIYPLGMEQMAPGIEMDGNERQELPDRFAFTATALFPTRTELEHYVFPAPAAAVEREIRAAAAKRADSSNPVVRQVPLPASASIPRNFLSITNRTVVNPPSKRIVPKPFGSRIQVAPRKRLSPIGEVLYSTGGGTDHLNTVHEELYGKTADVLGTPKAAGYKGGEGELTSGSLNEDVPLASSTSYGALNSPQGLRSRRRSSPLMPGVVLSEVERSPYTAGEPTAVVSPLKINKTHKRLSPNHRRSVTKSETVGLANLLETPLGVDADEEERKFTEFVRNLISRAHAHDRRSRPGQEQESVSGGTIDLGMAGMIAVKSGDPSHVGVPVLLPAPSFGAALSDFSVSNSTLASDVPGSSSRFSIGVAL